MAGLFLEIVIVPRLLAYRITVESKRLTKSQLRHIRPPEEQIRSKFTGAAVVAVAASAAVAAVVAGGRGVLTATCITRVVAAAVDGGSHRTPPLWATVTTTKVRSAERLNSLRRRLHHIMRSRHAISKHL